MCGLRASGSPARSRVAMNSHWMARLVIRAAVALTMVIHGVARVYLGGVKPFGEFLAGRGFPQGAALAWLLTGVEIAGGVALLLGFFPRPLAAWFAVQLAAGIALVHFREGWFVVGAGRNGMEYSVVLILCCVAIILLHSGKSKPAR